MLGSITSIPPHPSIRVSDIPTNSSSTSSPITDLTLNLTTMWDILIDIQLRIVQIVKVIRFIDCL